MLSTVLDKLQSLLPKRLLVTAAVPLLLFLAINLTLLAWCNRPFRSWVTREVLLADASWQWTAVVLVALMCVSQVIVLLVAPWQAFIEGKHWPISIKTAFELRQRRMFDQLQVRLHTAQDIEHRLGALENELHEARFTVGGKAHQPPANLQSIGADIETGGLEVFFDATARLEDALRAAVFPPPGGPVSSGQKSPYLDQLDALHASALEAADRHKTPLVAHINELVTEIQFRYGDGDLAPTALGNVSASVVSYAWTRYHIKFPELWARLQKVMQGESFYTVVQDAKEQLDFFVACHGLAVLSTLGWLAYNISVGVDIAFAGLTLVINGLLVWACYQLSVQSNLGFANLLRTSVDLYRFQVLDALHIARPFHSHEERRLWLRINAQLGYGQDVGIPYIRAKT